MNDKKIFLVPDLNKELICAMQCMKTMKGYHCNNEDCLNIYCPLNPKIKNDGFLKCAELTPALEEKILDRVTDEFTEPIMRVDKVVKLVFQKLKEEVKKT